MNQEYLIDIINLSYRYPKTEKYVLKNINVRIKRGDFVAVMGKNGSGKTSFCQCLNGIIPNLHHGEISGRVLVAGLDTQETSTALLAQIAGMVLDDPETQLFTTKVDNEVAFGPENLSFPVGKIKKAVQWALKVVRLQGYERRSPNTLSGGEKQRLAIAAVLAMYPEILILDEPTSQLDPVGTTEVFEVIKELKEKHNMTILIATHNSEEIAQFADKVLVLCDGEVLAYDLPENIFRDKELLEKAWIRPPQVSEFAGHLVEQGLKIGKFPILIEQTVKMLEDLLQGRSEND